MYERKHLQTRRLRLQTRLQQKGNSPGVQVQVKLAHHVSSAAVLHAVQRDVRVPDGGSVHQLEGQTQQLLVDVQQTLSHHLHRKILLQQVLIHRVLSLLHLRADEEEVEEEEEIRLFYVLILGTCLLLKSKYIQKTFFE